MFEDLWRTLKSAFTSYPSTIDKESPDTAQKVEKSKSNARSNHDDRSRSNENDPIVIRQRARKLLGDLDDPDGGVRNEAVLALPDICHQIYRDQSSTPETHAAASALAHMLVTDSNKTIHHNIGVTFCTGKWAEPTIVLDELIQATHSPLESARLAAASCLGRLEANAAPAVSDLMRLANDTSRRVCITAVDALRQIGAAAENALPLLINYLRADDIILRNVAVAAIGTINCDPQQAVFQLNTISADKTNFLPPGSNSEIFPDPNEFSMDPPTTQCHSAPVHWAVYSLRKFGPSASPAMSELLDLLKYDDELLRALVISVLVRIGDKKAIPPIIDLLAESDTPDRKPQTRTAVRSHAVSALKQLGTTPNDVVPTFATMLNCDSEEVRCRGIDALGELGRLGETSIPTLQSMLDDPNEQVQRKVSTAVERIHTDCSSSASHENQFGEFFWIEFWFSRPHFSHY